MLVSAQLQPQAFASAVSACLIAPAAAARGGCREEHCDAEAVHIQGGRSDVTLAMCNARRLGPCERSGKVRAAALHIAQLRNERGLVTLGRLPTPVAEGLAAERASDRTSERALAIAQLKPGWPPSQLSNQCFSVQPDKRRCSGFHLTYQDVRRRGRASEASEARGETAFLVFLISCIWYRQLKKYIHSCSSKQNYPAALIQGQVEPILPWISDTGSVGPQAAFFSQFIDSLCVLMSFIVYARYRQLEYYIHVKLPKVNPSISVEHLQRLDKFNFIALVVFVCSACLLMIPGNFRSTEWLLVHASMAVAGFTATYLYATLLVYLSNEMAKEGLESRPLTMAVITFTGILALIVLVVCGLISAKISPHLYFENHGRMFWNASQPGFYWHLASNMRRLCLQLSGTGMPLNDLNQLSDFANLMVNGCSILHSNVFILHNRLFCLVNDRNGVGNQFLGHRVSSALVLLVVTVTEMGDDV
ncbi:autophagy modulator [Tyrophagus putrescentiae]|nr:autophagy modulator [Tyrophagus putrescentiae]